MASRSAISDVCRNENRKGGGQGPTSLPYSTEDSRGLEIQRQRQRQRWREMEMLRCVQKGSGHVLRKMETFPEEDTRYRRHCTQDNDTRSPSKQAPRDLSQSSPSPRAALLYFPESHPWSEMSSFSKVILVLGKAGSHRAPNLGCRRAESSGWFDVPPKNSARDVMREQACCCDEAARHQVPTAAAFSVVQIVSVEACSRLTPAGADSLLQALSPFDHNDHTVHTLTQQHLPPPLTSTVKSSSLFTRVHPSPRSLAARSHRCRANRSRYVNNGWTFSRQTWLLTVCVCVCVCREREREGGRERERESKRDRLVLRHWLTQL